MLGGTPLENVGECGGFLTLKNVGEMEKDGVFHTFLGQQMWCAVVAGITLVLPGVVDDTVKTCLFMPK